MSEGFNVPALPFEKLKKVMQAYGRNEMAKGKDELSKATGIGAPSISKSNSFLVDLGLISPGQTKSPTEQGKKLAREIQFTNESAASEIWRAAVEAHEELIDALTILHVSGPMKASDFSGHILYCSQKPETSDNKTGARCIADVFIAAGLGCGLNYTIV